MKHTLKISVSKKPVSGGIVTCRQVGIRERLLRLKRWQTQWQKAIIRRRREAKQTPVKETNPTNETKTSVAHEMLRELAVKLYKRQF